MSLYQIKVKCNNQVFNYDLESDSLDDVIVLSDELLAGEILEIKEYMQFQKLSSLKKDYSNSKYVSVKVFLDDNSSFLLKIPSLKKSISYNEILTKIKNLYHNVKTIKVNYS